MIWHVSENGSSEKPPSIDKQSSRNYVILRKNFEEVPTYDESGQQVGTHWRYLEQFLNKKLYEEYDKIQNARADIDYISMMTGIDL